MGTGIRERKKPVSERMPDKEEKRHVQEKNHKQSIKVYDELEEHEKDKKLCGS